jgi:parallel beta-helix repeat protein
MNEKHRERSFKILFLFLTVVFSLFLQGAASPLVSINTTTSTHSEELAEKTSAAVCDGRAYERIQDAIDHASPGSTIYVNPGTYIEILTITKTLSLVGGGKEITCISPTSSKNSYAIRIAADDVVLSGFTITNHGDGLYTTGVKISASQVTIQECDIFDTPVGIAIWSSDNTISSCEFQGCDDEGIVVLGSSIAPCLHNTIRHCRFQSNCDGIELQYASDTHIEDCEFLENTHAGIDVIGSSNNNNMISECVFSGNQGFGLYLAGSSSNIITGCSFAGDSLTLVRSPGNTIQKSDVASIHLREESSLTLEQCRNVDESCIMSIGSQYEITTESSSAQSHSTINEQAARPSILTTMLARFTLLKEMVRAALQHDSV